METELYIERQRFAVGVCLFILCAVVLCVQMFVLDRWNAAWMPIGQTFVLLAILNALYIRTRVSSESVRVYFGLLVPFARDRIPIGDIVECRGVRYRAPGEKRYWGARRERFEGHKCRYYDTRGAMGVFIRTADRRLLIGSKHPEQLLEAIETARQRVPEDTLAKTRE